MSKIEEILQSKIKPKEKITLLVKEIKKNKGFVDKIVSYFECAPAGNQGHLIESLEYASQDHPESVVLHLDFVIKHLGDDAPRIKWECAKIIANIAKQFSEKTAKAVPALLENTKDKGTVVRWSVAFALGEIVKNNSKTKKQLLPIFKKIIKGEKNNGVKNVYTKALKAIEKEK